MPHSPKLWILGNQRVGGHWQLWGGGTCLARKNPDTQRIWTSADSSSGEALMSAALGSNYTGKFPSTGTWTTLVVCAVTWYLEMCFGTFSTLTRGPTSPQATRTNVGETPLSSAGGRQHLKRFVTRTENIRPRPKRLIKKKNNHSE